MSGTWVMQDNCLCGMIVASYENIPYAHMVTADKIFQDIRRLQPAWFESPEILVAGEDDIASYVENLVAKSTIDGIPSSTTAPEVATATEIPADLEKGADHEETFPEDNGMRSVSDRTVSSKFLLPSVFVNLIMITLDMYMVTTVRFHVFLREIQSFIRAPGFRTTS